MANWISSKLKAAETLLQQIDQQAAESLGKNEKLQSDDPLDVEESPRSHDDNKPLIKDQLKKKKSAENVVSQSIRVGRHSPNLISRSNSYVNRDDDTGRPLNLNAKSNSSSGLADGDWTELLKLPDKKGLPGGNLSGSNNRASGIRALKKDTKKVGHSGPGSNISLGDGRGENVRNTGILRGSRKSQSLLEGHVSSDNHEKANYLGDSRTSGLQSPSSTGFLSPSSPRESEQGERNLPLVPDNSNVKNEGRIEEVKDTADGEKENDGESNSDTDTASSSGSDSEREREERKLRRQRILAEKAAAKAVEAIKERENFVARLEGEKLSLERILEERANQQVQEASELQTTMMETMEAVELEKQKHNNTRMAALARLAKLERGNADLAKMLAKVQKNLDTEVNRLAELREQIHVKEATHEELRRKISSILRTGNKSQASKGGGELDMLEAEYSFITDKVARLQDQAKTLDTSIEVTRREMENPTIIELELKRRLNQLTDHLIQKQAQVETLISERAMLLIKIEAVSKLLDENNATIDSGDLPGTSSSKDLESGSWDLSNSKLKHRIKDSVQSGQQQLGSLVRQLDSLFCAGMMFLRRNSTARIWSIVYLICLHLWVLYIITSHSQVPEESRSGAVVSLENINNTGGGLI